MASKVAQTQPARNAIAVVTNKSWYEGFVPLFIHFAQRACPNADIFVFTMGGIDPLVPAALKAAGCDPAHYNLVADFGIEFGQSPLVAKMARWVVPLECSMEGYETVYIGDIDILLAIEPDGDLFTQHFSHSAKLGIPISNRVRPNSDRLTGLHFMRLREYMAKADVPLRELRDFMLEARDNPAALAARYPDPGGNEKALYDIVAKADASWIDSLVSAKFRPHHGVHLGLFRNEGRLGRVLIDALRSDDLDMPRYWNDVAPELAKTIQSVEWTNLFAAYPQVETSCRQFLGFYLDWRAGAYDTIVRNNEARLSSKDGSFA